MTGVQTCALPIFRVAIQGGWLAGAALDRGADVPERSLDFSAQSGHGARDHCGNQAGEQAILDGRCALLVAKELKWRVSCCLSCACTRPADVVGHDRPMTLHRGRFSYGIAKTEEGWIRPLAAGLTGNPFPRHRKPKPIFAIVFASYEKNHEWPATTPPLLH